MVMFGKGIKKGVSLNFFICGCEKCHNTESQTRAYTRHLLTSFGINSIRNFSHFR